MAKSVFLKYCGLFSVVCFPKRLLNFLAIPFDTRGNFVPIDTVILVSVLKTFDLEDDGNMSLRKDWKYVLNDSVTFRKNRTFNNTAARTPNVADLHPSVRLYVRSTMAFAVLNSPQYVS